MVLGGGVSLVKEMYQKFEFMQKSVEECIVACNDYAAEASESIKKLWDEDNSDLDHQNNVKESNSNIELEYNSLTDISCKNELSSANKTINSNGLFVDAENLGETSETFKSILDSTSSTTQNDTISEDNEVTASSRKCKYQCVENLSCNLHYEDTHTTQLDTSKLASGSTSSSRKHCNEVVEADIAEKLSENAKNDTIASIHEDTLVKTLPSESQESCNGHIDDKLSCNLHYEDTLTKQLDSSKLAFGSKSSPRQDCSEVVEASIAEKLSGDAKIDTIASIHEDTHIESLPSESRVLCGVSSCDGHTDDKLSEDSTEISDTFNLTSSSTCLTRQYCDQVHETDNDESCVLSMKVIDYSDINKDVQLSNLDKAFQIAQRDDYEEMESLNWIELEQELSLIQMRKAKNKNKSIKKKVQNVIKWLKRSNKVNHYEDGRNDIGFENDTTEEPPSIPSAHRSLSSQNSIDSGWELL